LGRRHAKGAAIAALLVVLATACSGSSTPNATKSTVGQFVSPSPTPKPSEDDRARAIVLSDADFPTGWQGTPHSDDPTEKEFERRLKACSGTAVNVGSTTDVFGDDFDMSQASVGSEVQFYRSAALVRADMATINNSRVLTCVRNLLTEQLKAELAKQGAQGATVRSVSLARFAIPRYADGSAALRLTATVSGAGRTFRFYQDVLVARKGRIEATASFFDLGGVFPSALERSLFAKLAARLVADGGA